MRASGTLLCLICAFGVVISCDTGRDGPVSPDSAASRISIPLDGENGARQVDVSPSPVDESYTPRIAIAPEDTLIAVYNVNLDLETSEEQVLLLKKKAAPLAPLRVVVIAYDNVLNDHRVSFEGDTLATNQNSTELLFVDLVGDHGTEIVCRGMDAAGFQTIDVFRKAVSPRGFGLYFESILALAVDGSVEVETVERSNAYKDGYANGESFPIITLATPEDADNLLDLVQRRYFWRFSDRAYVLGAEERISGAAVEQAQLNELYRSRAEAFEPWLSGVWFLESGEIGPTVYLYFEPEERRFTYFVGDLQEVYTWGHTYKILVNRVELTGVNEHVPYMRRNLYVQVDGIDRIRLLGTDSWVGSYRRMPDYLLRTNGYGATGVPRGEVDTAPFELDGRYVGDTGDVAEFRGDRFTLTEGELVSDGFFSIYQTNVPVLEMLIRDRTGIVQEHRRFRASYSEETRDNRVYRTLVLEPGVVGVYGFESSGDPVIRFEQIEELD